MSRRVDSFWTGVLGTDAGTGTSVGFCFGSGLVGRETEAAVVEGPGPPVISASSSSSSSSLIGAVTGAGAAEVEEAARLEGTNGAALELRRDLMGLADGGALDMLGEGVWVEARRNSWWWSRRRGAGSLSLAPRHFHGL